MNERIKQLEPQCWEHNEFGLNFNYQKFAELIVRECLAQVDKVDAMLEDDKEKIGVAWVGLAITKHFGVKE